MKRFAVVVFNMHETCRVVMSETLFLMKQGRGWVTPDKKLKFYKLGLTQHDTFFAFVAKTEREVEAFVMGCECVARIEDIGRLGRIFRAGTSLN